MEDSLRFWDDGIPLEPFAFAAGRDRPSEFTVESVIAGVRFEYVVEVDPAAVRYEGLFHYPEKKRRRIFEREGRELTLQRGLGGLSGTRELLTDRTLALSIARRFDLPLVSHFANDLLAIQTLGQCRRAYLPLPGTQTRHWFEEPGGGNHEDPHEVFRANRAQALALLKLADFGIEDVVIDEHEVPSPSADAMRTQRRVRLLHRSAQDELPFDFGLESEGTRTWFQLIGPVLTALKSGSAPWRSSLTSGYDGRRTWRRPT